MDRTGSLFDRDGKYGGGWRKSLRERRVWHDGNLSDRIGRVRFAHWLRPQPLNLSQRRWHHCPMHPCFFSTVYHSDYLIRNLPGNYLVICNCKRQNHDVHSGAFWSLEERRRRLPITASTPRIFDRNLLRIFSVMALFPSFIMPRATSTYVSSPLSTLSLNKNEPLAP
jgi:hypothetical protein